MHAFVKQFAHFYFLPYHFSLNPCRHFRKKSEETIMFIKPYIGNKLRGLFYPRVLNKYYQSFNKVVIVSFISLYNRTKLKHFIKAAFQPTKRFTRNDIRP